MKKQMKVPRGSARARRREGIPKQGTDERKEWDRKHALAPAST